MEVTYDLFGEEGFQMKETVKRGKETVVSSLNVRTLASCGNRRGRVRKHPPRQTALKPDWIHMRVKSGTTG
jgi:hypothetical protein